MFSDSLFCASLLNHCSLLLFRSTAGMLQEHPQIRLQAKSRFYFISYPHQEATFKITKQLQIIKQMAPFEISIRTIFTKCYHTEHYT